MNSRERIELFLCNIKENTVIEASRIYTFLADDMTEAAFYKTLERFCQSGSLVHLTKGLYYKPKQLPEWQNEGSHQRAGYCYSLHWESEGIGCRL